MEENILFSLLGRTLFEVHSEQVYLASPPNPPHAEERGRGTLTCGVGILRRHRITSVLSAAVGNPNGPPNVSRASKNLPNREKVSRVVSNSDGATSKPPACRREGERKRERERETETLTCDVRIFVAPPHHFGSGPSRWKP